MPPKKKPDPRIVYADIIDLPHHEPDPIKHPRMPLYKRAAQFAPFAALRGYEGMVNEEIRVTEVSHKRELNEEEERELNQKLNRIMELTAFSSGPSPISTSATGVTFPIRWTSYCLIVGCNSQCGQRSDSKNNKTRKHRTRLLTYGLSYFCGQHCSRPSLTV